MIACTGCGAQVRPGLRFCPHCGRPQELRCEACGATLEPEDRFCGSCGTSVGAAGAGGTGERSPGAQPLAERRLVSVLFADLVGFTTLSEHRDPEEVRELLSQYFERCRALIERYGGTVEKFIGDAVMAVWGTPVAREDDAERAVRAALALTQAVRRWARRSGCPSFRVRAGVLTGNAAVELGAEGEGMVLGDTVNTASRLQSIAAPGTVLVDDATRRASEAAIAYEDAGEPPVKGREQPVRAWTALRVVAGAGGARRSVGTGGPVRGPRARAAGDHRGGRGERQQEGRRGTWRSWARPARASRGCCGSSSSTWTGSRTFAGGIRAAACPTARASRTGRWPRWCARGPGSTRRRARRGAGKAARERRASSCPTSASAGWWSRGWLTCCASRSAPDADRADLFSGWRLFFERMAGTEPVVLAFEDLQWADSGLLDFIDYLLEWSAESRSSCSRSAPGAVRAPAGLEAARRSSRCAATRSPRCSSGLAPGLPEELVREIGRRSEGIPLYAVETMRMLQDRGVLVAGGRALRRRPATSQTSRSPRRCMRWWRRGWTASRPRAVAAAGRLGARPVVHRPGAAALSAAPEAEVTRGARRSGRQTGPGRDDDPRSPERGQYVFLQALVRTVAYGTLSRRARKAAPRGGRAAPRADVARRVAGHRRGAGLALPGGDPGRSRCRGCRDLRASARETLTEAGRAAASLALGPEAERYFEQAAELAEDDLERAGLFEQAGRALLQSGNERGAEQRLRDAIETYKRGGRTSGGSAAVALGYALRSRGQVEAAREVLEDFLATQDEGVSEIVRAEAQAQLAAVAIFSGSLTEGRQPPGDSAGDAGGPACLGTAHRLTDHSGCLPALHTPSRRGPGRPEPRHHSRRYARSARRRLARPLQHGRHPGRGRPPERGLR